MAACRGYKDGDKELIVVTIIVAADGSFKLPQVDNRTSLRDALSILGSVRWVGGWVGGRMPTMCLLVCHMCLICMCLVGCVVLSLVLLLGAMLQV